MPTKPSDLPKVAVAATGPGGADYEQGRALLAQGRAADALGPLSRAVSAAPTNAGFQWVYGEALLATSARDEALSHFGDAARASPDYRVRYGRALDQAGKNAEAAAVYEEAVTGEPDNMLIQEELGRLYYKLGNFAKAAPLLDKATASRPDPVLKQELAYATEKAGNKDRAVELYRSVLSIAPGADVSRGRLADLLFEQGKGDEALSVLQDGVTQNPSLPALRRDLGTALERAGKAQDAIREYREYARQAPDAPDAKEVAARATRLEGGGKS
jgi:predicted Zn-dependent protease